MISSTNPMAILPSAPTAFPHIKKAMDAHTMTTSRMPLLIFADPLDDYQVSATSGIPFNRAVRNLAWFLK
jgi:hypothetical protein